MAEHEQETDDVFVPEDVEEQNVPEGDKLDADPDLPHEEDPEFLAEVVAGEDEGEDDE